MRTRTCRWARAAFCWNRPSSPAWCSLPRSPPASARWWSPPAPATARRCWPPAAPGSPRSRRPRLCGTPRAACWRSCALGVSLVAGPLGAGWPPGAPYDVILIEGAVRDIPPAIGEQLHRQTGRLVTVCAGSRRPRPGGAGRGHSGRPADAADVRLRHAPDPQPACRPPASFSDRHVIESLCLAARCGREYRP